MAPLPLLDDLRARVKASGLGVRELADLAGIDKGQVSRFIAGAGLGLESALKLMKTMNYQIVPPPKTTKKKA